MTNLYMPASAAIISFILLFAYFSKRRLKIKENNIYLVMISCIFSDSVLLSIIYFVSPQTDTEVLIKVLNRIDYMALVTWSTCLCLYTHTVIHKKDTSGKLRFRIIRGVLCASAVVESIVIWILRLDATVENGLVTTIYGPSVYFTFSCCAVNVLLSLIVILLNIKKVTKQITPVYICIGMAGLCALAYYIDPGISGVSMGLTIVNLTMYFTIENPDVQMLEKVNLAREQAVRASSLKTDFLSNMSHEIRTPINAIVGLAECIQNDETLEAAQADARDIMGASENLLEIVNGILDISKIEAGRMDIVNKEYDLVDMAEKLSKLIKARIGEKPIELRCCFSADIPGVLFGDETKVRQIMTNLLTNAVKYTDRGHIDFVIGCENVGNLSTLKITVYDTGHGIKEEVIPTLFDKFKRLEEDRNSGIEGTGLGLAITKTFVEMLGGTIEVHSTYGVGSSFTFKVSQEIRSMERKKAEKQDTSKKDYSGRRVLVVDDVTINQLVVKRILEFYKIEVDTASSGSECIDKCAGKAYNLILLDDMMPNMSGTETLALLKEKPSFITPVVVCTANAIEGMRDKYISDGFSDYLSKPIIQDELNQLLEKFLG